MNRPSSALLLLWLLMVPSLALAADETLETQVSLLIGFPGETEPSTRGTLVVPGMVIPLPEAPRVDRRVLEKEASANASLVRVTEGLRKTLRLGDISVSYSTPFELAVDAIRDLPPPSSGSDVRLSIRLLGFSDTSASYEVQFFSRSTPIADTRVAAVRGERAVVGGLNGTEAPYLFLVVEPRAAKAPPSMDAPVFVEGDVIPPRAIEKKAPSYPEEARKAGLEGIVTLQSVVRKDGSVGEVTLIRDSTGGELAEAAIEAIRQWRFEPALLGGNPVDVYYNLTVNFRLGDKKEKETDKPSEEDG